jgi:voltage-gated potassium channel Kch
MKEATGLEKTGESDPEKDIALLGFYRTASSLLNEIMESGLVDRGLPLKDRLVVVDFNPEIHDSLQSLGVKVVYGDISHPDTLHHAGIHDVKIVISTIPDTILVGTDNLTIIRHMRELCPHARVVVTAESVERALKMYAEGADYVFLPRIIAARSIMEAVKVILEGGEGDIKAMKKDEVEKLSLRNEVMR